MGGNYFGRPRMPRADYLRREFEVIEALERLAPGRYMIPKYFGDKADFGDMDVIVSSDLFKNRRFDVELYDYLGVTLRGRPNKGVYSGLYRDLAVDLFLAPPQSVGSSWAFMSWGDAGNILGRMVRPFGCKLSHSGLEFVFSQGTHFKRELRLTRKFSETCRLLDLDYELWSAGFNTEREMFDWVVSSPYFSPAPYLCLESANPDSKTRPGMNRFAEYVRSAMLPERSTRSFNRIERLQYTFPHINVRGWIEQQQASFSRSRDVAGRFNGRIVMSLRPELAGKALGAFIHAFRASRGDDFETWVLESTGDEISTAIKNFGAP